MTLLSLHHPFKLFEGYVYAVVTDSGQRTTTFFSHFSAGILHMTGTCGVTIFDQLKIYSAKHEMHLTGQKSAIIRMQTANFHSVQNFRYYGFLAWQKW